MPHSPPDWSTLRAEERSPAGFRQSRDAQGLFGAGGNRYPTAAIGTGNVVALPDGEEWHALVCRRGAAVAHPGRWGLLGGYLDLEASEGPLEAAMREIREETNGCLRLEAHRAVTLGHYLDYVDRYNAQTLAIGYLHRLDAAQGAAVRGWMASGAMVNDEAVEFRLVSLARIAETFAELEAAGGIGYPQEKRFLLLAHDRLRDTRDADPRTEE